jgi:serine protease Do
VAIAALLDEAASGARPDIAGELATVAARLRRSTVQVRGRGPGGGSGVIWRPDGLIITNAHVARGPRATVELWDGRVLAATVTARDPQRDLAALAVDASDLPAAPVADSGALRVGELVLAVGNPFGVVGALTIGIVHAIGLAGEGGRQRWVQADVRLAPGNSGGPLADARGRVIGINSMIAGGLALAVPSNAVERFLRGGDERPYLGVSTRPVLVPVAGAHLLGLLVLDVAAGSPAAAGLLIGDVLVGVGGRPFAEPADLADALDDAGPGGALHLDLIRGGRRGSVSVVIARGGETPLPPEAEAA